MSIKMRAAVVILLAGFAGSTTLNLAQSPQSTLLPSDVQVPMTAAQIAEAKQADGDFQASNLAAALPLYEDLARQVPQKAVYAERLAFCLLSKADNMPPGAEQQATFERAVSEANRAKSLGDNSNLLQSMLDRMNSNPADGGRVDANVAPEALQKMRAAESAFAKGDLDAALSDYKSAASADPKLYDAPLFAGDMYFRKKDPRQAGEWFQKAIAINPNRETAYRYWGDVLSRAGQQDAARDKYIDAVIAEPYARQAWVGLRQWAQRNNVVLISPSVPRPKAPEVARGINGAGVNIGVDPSTFNDPASGKSAWFQYQLQRTAWLTSLFARNYPSEKQYRHTLAEEVDALSAVVSAVNKQNIAESNLDPSLRDLMRLARDNMIEPFVLINGADRDIALDYAAYREIHRDQLHAYILKYVINAHGNENER